MTTKLSPPISVADCFSVHDLSKTLDELHDVGVSFETCSSLAELQLKLAVAGKDFTQDVMSTILVAMCYEWPMGNSFLEEVISCAELHQYVFNLKLFTLAYFLEHDFSPYDKMSFQNKLWLQNMFWRWHYQHGINLPLSHKDFMKTIISAITKKMPLMPFHFYDANKSFLHLHDLDFVMMLEKYACDLVRKDSKYKAIRDAFLSSVSSQRNISQFMH